MYIEILDNLSIPSIENGDDETLFQNDNVKYIEVFLQGRYIKSMTWPANLPNLNPIENQWYGFWEMVHEKTPSIYCYSRKLEHFDKAIFCFKWVKSIS